jgi:glycosyltransferase involved in cell wall biosynthesis
MRTIGYFPFVSTSCSAEAGWLRQHLPVIVQVANEVPALNDGPAGTLPELASLLDTIRPFLTMPAIVAEGPGGFLWAALLRAYGFAGSVTILPYLNPWRWSHVAAVSLYRRFADPRDRVFLGSAPSAAVYRSLGVPAVAGEPYGIDEELFRLRPGAAGVRDKLGIPHGRLLLFAGRAQADKDLYRVLRVALKARLLFPGLQIVVASHVSDPAYLAVARQELRGDAGVHFVVDPDRGRLADLYNTADVFVTASTSHFETFGRAPAEALACGSPVVAPRYDGFAEVLAQPGGTLVDVRTDPVSGAPDVPEELLLRAVYEVLSAPRPPARAEISANARRRYGRSSTIRLLAHLAGEDTGRPQQWPPPAPPAPASAPVELPRQWKRALAGIGNREPDEALSWFWHGCDHRRLGAHDDEFAVQIRRSLCQPVAGAEPELVTCP